MPRAFNRDEIGYRLALARFLQLGLNLGIVARAVVVGDALDSFVALPLDGFSDGQEGFQ